MRTLNIFATTATTHFIIMHALGVKASPIRTVLIQGFSAEQMVDM